MKKIIYLPALFILLITNAFATPKSGVNDNVKASFTREFKNAEQVSWQNDHSFVKATFKLNAAVLFAYYSPEGQLMAVSRNILTSQLPASLQKTIKKNYRNYWVTDLFELNRNGRTSYYISLESADQTIILKSYGYSWEIYDAGNK